MGLFMALMNRGKLRGIQAFDMGWRVFLGKATKACRIAGIKQAKRAGLSHI